MWLLSNEVLFEGRRLWLRPGKTYLFGRTASEPGQLAISHNTISRKHLTITVSDVENGEAHNPSSRSKLTIEDLATKIGTMVNGKKIKGNKIVLNDEMAELTMGKCPHEFRITWHPVVFAFSFTKKELQAHPLSTLHQRFEQLDIKLITDYAQTTTHVVSKKRNTAKGLQALINGKFIVTESFLDAIVDVTGSPDGDGVPGSSPLEQDFDRCWPDAMKHLPPRGGEPVEHPDAIYQPSSERKEVFEGYTFIFYEKSQYENLVTAIASGGGKALLGDLIPQETQVDDFVRYVKNVAGEKGLGAFDDGSEGKGVVLVRYLPSKGNLVQWYTDFITAVSLRLDHRPIEQSEFLEAILTKDASILRRPLEVESSQITEEQHNTTISTTQGNARNGRHVTAAELPAQNSEVVEPSQPATRRTRTRRPVKKRFAGFDDDEDVDMDESPATNPSESRPAAAEEEGLFVSQDPDAPSSNQGSNATRTSQRKRAASPFPEDDLMDGMAPAAAKFKRQRIERGEDLDARTPEPEETPAETQPATTKKIKKEIDILAMAAKNREQEEARARAEKEDLANLPNDIDLAEIRRLQIVEEMDVRAPASHARTREQDIADGRWDPKWNGMKNFKKFRRRGQVTGRQPARVIVPLTEVKNKEFGVGDDYWLEDEGEQRKKTASQTTAIESQVSAPSAPTRPAQRRQVVLSEDSDEEEEAPPVRTRTQSQKSQSSRTTSQASKRAAPEPAKEQPAKRPRATRRVLEIADSDDSDDELKFRFGKRR